MQYTAPVNVDLSNLERSAIYRQKRIRACTAHANWAARKYARNIVTQLKSSYNAKLDDFGGEIGIARTMATYKVFEPLRSYAARVCMRLVRERLIK
jgi:hypothetical protein